MVTLINTYRIKSKMRKLYCVRVLVCVCMNLNYFRHQLFECPCITLLVALYYTERKWILTPMYALSHNQYWGRLVSHIHALEERKSSIFSARSVAFAIVLLVMLDNCDGQLNQWRDTWWRTHTQSTLQPTLCLSPMSSNTKLLHNEK